MVGAGIGNNPREITVDGIGEVEVDGRFGVEETISCAFNNGFGVPVTLKSSNERLLLVLGNSTLVGEQGRILCRRVIGITKDQIVKIPGIATIN
ncbi:MAG: hypothetical protein PHS92_01265 [Candidatus Gracilibacteria bacterium]|nr:hypothetical protein [Candidatus Gracilibacteria bacterium]